MSKDTRVFSTEYKVIVVLDGLGKKSKTLEPNQ